MPTDFMKRLLEKGSAATLEHFAKAQIAGRDTGLRQVDWVFAIQKFADLTFPDKLTPQQRFSRALDTPEGKLLFKAMDAAPPPSYEPEPVEKDDGPRHAGPASAEMFSRALDRQRSRGIPFSSAYYETYIHPDNQTLREQVKREELDRALAGVHGDGVSGTLTIQDAQRKAPARSFRGTGYDRDIAEKKLQALADARHAAHPEESAAQSYVRVMLDPQHAEIRKAALAVA